MVYKWAQAQEVGRVKAIMAQKDKAAAAAINALDSYYKASAKIDRTVIKEVIRYVPTAAVCDVSAGELRLLNESRLGLSQASGGAAGADSRPSPAGKLPRAVEVEAHIDCGLRYRQIKAQCSALIGWANKLNEQ